MRKSAKNGKEQKDMGRSASSGSTTKATVVLPAVFLALRVSLLLTVSSCMPAPVSAEYTLPVPSGKSLETTNPPGIVPAIGKWLIAPHGLPADWLGQLSDGMKVIEPINVVIVDMIAKSGDEAETRLVAACASAGFQARTGHSSGYGGIIGGFVYPELPRGPGDAFSDEPFVLANNHGRIFGPHRLHEGWLFIGAFSRERIDLARKIPHTLESMNQARDRFIKSMVLVAGYEVAGFIGLDNAIVGNPELHAGDHDGVAVMIRATR